MNGNENARPAADTVQPRPVPHSGGTGTHQEPAWTLDDFKRFVSDEVNHLLSDKVIIDRAVYQQSQKRRAVEAAVIGVSGMALGIIGTVGTLKFMGRSKRVALPMTPGSNTR